MPPFISTDCPHCHQHNRFDVAELRKMDGGLYKGTIYRSTAFDETFGVTCQHCGRPFKFEKSQGGAIMANNGNLSNDEIIVPSYPLSPEDDRTQHIF